jgi:hypothetical protein
MIVYLLKVYSDRYAIITIMVLRREEILELFNVYSIVKQKKPSHC